MYKSARIMTGAAALTMGLAVMAGGQGASAQTSSASATPPAFLQMASDGVNDMGSPALSHSGRYVAYVATLHNQVPLNTQLRLADLAGGGSELLNRSIDGGRAAGNYSMPPVISADGSRVAFTSNSARLVAGDTNGRWDAFVRNASTDTTLLASRAIDGDASNGASGMTSLSKNGRYAVFTSTGTDVVAGSTTTNSDVYRRDLNGNTTLQVTVRPNGAPSKGPGSNSADVSADGNLVAFNSYNADILATDDADLDSDLYIRNMTTGQTRWLSQGVPGGANPSGVVISPDGRWVSSRWDDGSLHLTRVDTGVTSTVAAEGYALTGAFSSQLGRFVFVSDGKPWVRDLASGVNTAIPTPNDGSVATVTVSGNGQFAAYDWIPADGGLSTIYRVAL